jgi:hypothetical protein
LVDGDTVVPIRKEDKDNFTDILSIDTIYYPGILEFIKKSLVSNNNRKAYVVFNAYTTRVGVYSLKYDEGSF